MSSIISVQNLGKKYILSHQSPERYTALRDVIANSAKRTLKKFRHPFAATEGDETHEEFWALKDVSFDIQQGDRVGIIDSAEHWKVIRELGNAVNHEYEENTQ